MSTKGDNYEEVGMEMSSEDDNDEGNMFATREEYKAYKKQFDPSHKEEANQRCVEQGEYGGRSGPAGSSEYGSIEPQMKAKKSKKERSHQSTEEDEDDREFRKRMEELKNKSSEKKQTEAAGNMSQGHDKDDGSNKESLGSSQRKDREHDKPRHRDHHHHHRHRRHSRSHSRSRSRSPSRRRGRRRRSRSREDRSRRSGGGGREHCSSKRSPPRQSHQTHQERRERKLQALGLGDSEFHTKQMEAQMAKVKEMTGVEVPKYYNPSAINPLKYADQIKKRQMLWGKKPSMSFTPASSSSTEGKEQDPDIGGGEKNERPVVVMPPSQTLAAAAPSGSKQSFNKWETTNFGNSQKNEKFRRLMGIKSDVGNEPAPQTSSETMFARQEEHYERARAITHTRKGMGLGFSAAENVMEQMPNPPPQQSQAPPMPERKF